MFQSYVLPYLLEQLLLHAVKELEVDRVAAWQEGNRGGQHAHQLNLLALQPVRHGAATKTRINVHNSVIMPVKTTTHHFRPPIISFVLFAFGSLLTF